MRKLPEKQRIVFVMKVVLDLSYQEISGTLGISENVIKARLHRARINLLNHFQNKCRWFMQGESTSCCREKAGYILSQDTEALKRVFEGMKDFNSDNEDVRASKNEDQKLEQIYRQVQIPHQSPDVELIKSYVFQA